MHCAAVISIGSFILPQIENLATPLHFFKTWRRSTRYMYSSVASTQPTWILLIQCSAFFKYKICDCYSGSIRWGWSQTAQTQQRGYDPTFSVEITIYLLIKAFRTYVRPILEYSRPVWSPHTIGMINSIEWVQRRFTKKLVGMPSLTYDERCASLRLDRLELRRLHSDLFNLF